MQNKEIKVLVSWPGENYNGGLRNSEIGAVIATGIKQPRPSSRERIIQGIHSIGRMALSLY